MSRVSIKTKADLPAELQPLWEKMTTYGAFENQAGVMAVSYTHLTLPTNREV